MTRLAALEGAACLVLAVLATAACDRKPATPPDTIPPVAKDTTVPGGAATEVPARTGSQASGTLGSSVVIGAPPKDKAGLAFAH